MIKRGKERENRRKKNKVKAQCCKKRWELAAYSKAFFVCQKANKNLDCVTCENNDLADSTGFSSRVKSVTVLGSMPKNSTCRRLRGQKQCIGAKKNSSWLGKLMNNQSPTWDNWMLNSYNCLGVFLELN